jgi:hypothetical protein
VIDVENEDALARILETTDGRGVDVMRSCDQVRADDLNPGGLPVVERNVALDR